MTASLLLDVDTWDLTLDSAGNVAIEQEPDVLAQDAACAIQLWLTEYYWDTTQGVPWAQRILGVNPPPLLSVLKQILITAALSANSDIASAQVFLSSFSDRNITGQVQVTSITGETSAASFSVVSPQGGY
jgi:hypothetical protein